MNDCPSSFKLIEEEKTRRKRDELINYFFWPSAFGWWWCEGRWVYVSFNRRHKSTIIFPSVYVYTRITLLRTMRLSVIATVFIIRRALSFVNIHHSNVRSTTKFNEQVFTCLKSTSSPTLPRWLMLKWLVQRKYCDFIWTSTFLDCVRQAATSAKAALADGNKLIEIGKDYTRERVW